MNHHKYIEKLERKNSITLHYQWEPGEGAIGSYSKGDIKKFKNQVKEYGFDERETYELWQSAAICLYERMKMFLKMAPKVVDYTTYTFNIPILIENTKKERKITSNYFHKLYCNSKQIGAMETMTDYLEKGLVLTASLSTKEKGMEYLQVAFEIFTIIMPAVWW